MDDQPSLNGLRAVEAVARRGSVKAAAEELHVTPGAVSQQVKGVEAALGMPLFQREGNGVRLTAAGAGLFPVLRSAFEEIGSALARLRHQEGTGPLTVTVLPSFASKWLVPRLGSFQSQHPDIDVRISATSTLVDLTREDMDVGIRLGRGNYPGLHCERLFRDSIFPVCSPSLPSPQRPLETPEQLQGHRLLHDESYDEWETWLNLHDVQGVTARRGAIFSDASMALQAAIAGQGVAMARGELVAQDLEEERLVRPFAQEAPYALAYYVVSRPNIAEWPKVVAFRSWLHREARRFRRGRRAPFAPSGPQAG